MQPITWVAGSLGIWFLKLKIILIFFRESWLMESLAKVDVFQSLNMRLQLLQILKVRRVRSLWMNLRAILAWFLQPVVINVHWLYFLDVFRVFWRQLLTWEIWRTPLDFSRLWLLRVCWIYMTEHLRVATDVHVDGIRIWTPVYCLRFKPDCAFVLWLRCAWLSWLALAGSVFAVHWKLILILSLGLRPLYTLSRSFCSHRLCVFEWLAHQLSWLQSSLLDRLSLLVNRLCKSCALDSVLAFSDWVKLYWSLFWFLT